MKKKKEGKDKAEFSTVFPKKKNKLNKNKRQWKEEKNAFTDSAKNTTS